jgi:hypothetical protein
MRESMTGATKLGGGAKGRNPIPLIWVRLSHQEVIPLLPLVDDLFNKGGFWKQSGKQRGNKRAITSAKTRVLTIAPGGSQSGS